MQHLKALYACLAADPHRGGVSTGWLGRFQAAILPRAGIERPKAANLPLLHTGRGGAGSGCQ